MWKTRGIKCRRLNKATLFHLNGKKQNLGRNKTDLYRALILNSSTENHSLSALSDGTFSSLSLKCRCAFCLCSQAAITARSATCSAGGSFSGRWSLAGSPLMKSEDRLFASCGPCTTVSADSLCCVCACVCVWLELEDAKAVFSCQPSDMPVLRGGSEWEALKAVFSCTAVAAVHPGQETHGWRSMLMGQW